MTVEQLNRVSRHPQRGKLVPFGPKLGAVPSGSAAKRIGTKGETVDLPEQYLKDAEPAAQRRVAVAGMRLGRILEFEL